MYVTPEQRATPPQFDYDAFELPRNVSLEMVLNPHNGPEDLPDEAALRQEIKDADALIIEFSSNSDPAIWLNKIAKGDYKTYQYWKNHLNSTSMDFGAWAAHMFAALYNTRTAVTTIDIDAVRDPFIQKLDRAQSRHDDRVSSARTNHGVVSAAPLLADVYQVMRGRDQKLLGNIQPRIDALTAQHRDLASKRASSPAHIPVFYGSTHRSLLDALNAKNELVPTEGFEAKVHPDSTPTMPFEEGYALFLRGMPIPEELLIYDAGAKYIQTSLYVSGSLHIDHSMKHARLLADEVIAATNSAHDYALMRQVGDTLARMGISFPDELSARQFI